MRVRSFLPEDLSACLEVFDSNIPTFFQVEEREEFLAFLQNLPGPYLVVLDQAGEIVGCGGYALREDGRTADLCWGMVHGDRHREGFGDYLTRSRIDRVLQDPSVLELALNTSQKTTGFYENVGFRIIEVKEDGYGPGFHRCEMRMGVDGEAR